MSDREAAEKWVDSSEELDPLRVVPAYCDGDGCLDDAILYAMEAAHLAGQAHEQLASQPLLEALQLIAGCQARGDEAVMAMRSTAQNALDSHRKAEEGS